MKLIATVRVPHVEVEVGDPGVLPEQLDAGVRHHDVDLEPAAGGRGEPGHHTVLVGNVHVDGDRIRKRCGGGPRCRQVAVGEGNHRAFRGEAGGQVFADAASRARDEGRPAGKSKSHGVILTQRQRG